MAADAATLGSVVAEANCTVASGSGFLEIGKIVFDPLGGKVSLVEVGTAYCRVRMEHCTDGNSARMAKYAVVCWR